MSIPNAHFKSRSADADQDRRPDPPDLPPWDYEFFSLMRWISARDQTAPPVGEAMRPQQESFRLGQKPAMTFAPREVAELGKTDGRLQVRLFGLGLLGPNGPMPLQFTDFVRDRAEAHQDATLASFLDIFHHRYLATLYRAWVAGQAAAGLDRARDERFSGYIDSLGNCDAGHLSSVPSHARLAAAAHLVREARNPEGIAATLSHFFGVPVTVQEFVPHWIDIDPGDLACLARPGPAAMLGEGAFIGEKILDSQHHFRIVVGPLSLEQYLTFTPEGQNLPQLIEWVRAFVGLEFAWEAELRIAPQAAPATRIGGNERLGWSTWLGETAADVPTTGMIFQPEETLCH